MTTKPDYRPVKGLYTDYNGTVAVLVHGWEVDTPRSTDFGADDGEKLYAFSGALPYDPTRYCLPEGEFLSKYPQRIDGIKVEEDDEETEPGSSTYSTPYYRRTFKRNRLANDLLERTREEARRREELGRLLQAVQNGGGMVRVQFEINGVTWDVLGIDPDEGEPRIVFSGSTVVLSMNADTVEGSVTLRDNP